MSNEELLAGTNEDKMNRLLLFMRDGFRRVNEKVDKHIAEAKIQFEEVDRDIYALRKANEALTQRLNNLENKQANDQVLSEYHSKKYNLIINNLPEVMHKWETNTESIDIVHTFFKGDLKVENADNMQFVNAHRIGMRKNNQR